MKYRLNSFSEILQSLYCDLKFGLVLLGLLSISRLSLLIAYGSDFEVGEMPLWLLRGFQFDMRAVAFFVLPTLLLGWTPLVVKLRKFVVPVGLAVSVFLCIANFFFFREYHDQFNHWVFGLIYDDLGAILKTIYGAFPVIPVALFLGILVYSLVKWGPKIYNTKRVWDVRMPLILKGVVLVLVVGCFFVALRGSVGSRPLQRKDVAITRSDFLNRTILNPYFALYYAFKDHRLKHSSNGLKAFLKDGESLEGAARRVFGVGGEDLDLLAKKEVSGSVLRDKPEHIFYIVMESQDAWPLLEAYGDLNLTPRLKELSGKSMYSRYFVSAGPGTMPSLNAIILGLPYTGVHANYQPSTRKTLPTALAKQFKELGYEANFFYGGYLSWQNVGSFAKAQGFDRVYGGSHMGPWTGNEWGVEDKQLFDFIRKVVGEAEGPTFNLIMTTSNHPKYTVDLEREGCPVREMPESLEGLYDGSTPLRVLFHAWYADKCVGEFVEGVESDFPTALFAITGDHWSRHFLNNSPSLYERKAVPCIIYSKGIEPRDLGCGSHIDIAPTLVDMVGPVGHSYRSFGRSMVSGVGGGQCGYGSGVIIEGEAFYEVNDPETPRHLTSGYQALHALAWYRVMKGADISKN